MSAWLLKQKCCYIVQPQICEVCKAVATEVQPSAPSVSGESSYVEQGFLVEVIL